MKHEPKFHVLKLLLKFVGTYLPIKQARIAGLGGDGWETEIWKKAGVASENGWLIERNRKLSRRLISGTPYRYHPNLSTFPTMIRSIFGNGAGIDLFNLDLCGTLKPNLDIFRPIVPLITKNGKGHCLAITEADQRRNLSLEQFPRIYKDAQDVLGKKTAVSFLSHLRNEQRELPQAASPKRFGTPADPEKGARREMGLFCDFLQLLRASGGSGICVPSIPDKMERYMYISRYRGHPFRMRTYFFHFARQEPSLNPGQAAQKLANLWKDSGLKYFQNGDPLPKALKKILRKEEIERMIMMKIDKIELIAQAVGGEALEQFEQLVKNARRESAAAGIVSGIRKLLKGYEEEEGAAAVEPHPRRNSARSGKKSPGNPPLEFKNGDRIAVQLDMLRAKAAGEEAFLHLRGEISDKLIGNRRRTAKQIREINRHLGPLFARTHGAFKANFAKRAAASLSDQTEVPRLIAELAKIYTAIGEPVTAEELKQEAGI